MQLVKPATLTVAETPHRSLNRNTPYNGVDAQSHSSRRRLELHTFTLPHKPTTCFGEISPVGFSVCHGSDR